MKRLHLIILLLSLLSGCTSPWQRAFFASEESLKDIPDYDLKELLGIDLITRDEIITGDDEFKVLYSGYYHYIKDPEGKFVLHGPFFFEHEDDGAYYAEGDGERFLISEYAYIFRYSGSYERGNKVGRFTADILYDDGIDIFSDYKLSITYSPDSDKCASGSFEGRIGHSMPERTYDFSRLQKCTFREITDLAWAEWQKEYAARQRQ